MWIQEPDKERPRPAPLLRDYLMVNNRGRVVLVLNEEVKELTTQGFRMAPKGSKVGDYVPVFDRGDNPEDLSLVAMDEKTVNQPDLLQVVEIR